MLAALTILGIRQVPASRLADANRLHAAPRPTGRGAFALREGEALCETLLSRLGIDLWALRRVITLHRGYLVGPVRQDRGEGYEAHRRIGRPGVQRVESGATSWPARDFVIALIFRQKKYATLPVSCAPTSITALGRLLMHKLALILISAISLASSSAFAASYQQNDGTIVDRFRALDPATGNFAGNHPYSGNNLEPFADLFNANLTNADLSLASLSDAILTGANLSGANLYAELSFASRREPVRRDPIRYRREPDQRGPDAGGANRAARTCPART